MEWSASLPPDALNDAVNAIAPAVAEAAIRLIIPLTTSEAKEVAVLVICTLTEANFVSVMNRDPNGLPAIHHIVAAKLKSFAMTRLTIALARTHPRSAFTDPPAYYRKAMDALLALITVSDQLPP